MNVIINPKRLRPSAARIHFLQVAIHHREVTDEKIAREVQANPVETKQQTLKKSLGQNQRRKKCQ